jgi:hypothetical protein
MNLGGLVVHMLIYLPSGSPPPSYHLSPYIVSPNLRPSTNRPVFSTAHLQPTHPVLLEREIEPTRLHGARARSTCTSAPAVSSADVSPPPLHRLPTRPRQLLSDLLRPADASLPNHARRVTLPSRGFYPFRAFGSRHGIVISCHGQRRCLNKTPVRKPQRDF